MLAAPFYALEHIKWQLVGLFAAAGGLGPLVLRGLAKSGTFVPIFDWGSFSFTPSVIIAL